MLPVAACPNLIQEVCGVCAFLLDAMKIYILEEEEEETYGLATLFSFISCLLGA
jgi:hypothetical protein